MAAVLHELRRARFRRRLGDLDPFETFLNAYLAGAVVIAVLALVSAVLGQDQAPPDVVRRIEEDGAAVAGILAAAVVALGLRSGSLGGPLAMETPEVLYVALAPIDRRVTLRGPTVRAVRFGAFVGSACGAAIGLIVASHLPGGVLRWTAYGTMTGLVTSLLFLGAAMLAAGRRMGRRLAVVLGVALLAASATSAALGWPGPLSPVGWLALAAFRPRTEAWAAAPVVAAVLVAGLVAVPGLSLELAHRRSQLVGQLRFAATMQDLRTTLVLRRQLAQEQSRRRPWVRRTWWAPASLPVWRRGWRGAMRWPIVRPLRMLALGGLAGGCAAAYWRGTEELLAGTAVLLWLAGLDAVEALAQEEDHPDRADTAPVSRRWLRVRHLPVAVALMFAPAAACAGALALLSGDPAATRAAWASAALLAVSAPAGAALSTIQGAPEAFAAKDLLVTPEVAAMSKLTRLTLPILVAAAGVLPLVVARLTLDPPQIDPNQPTPSVLDLGMVLAGFFLFTGAKLWARFRGRER